VNKHRQILAVWKTSLFSSTTSSHFCFLVSFLSWALIRFLTQQATLYSMH